VAANAAALSALGALLAIVTFLGGFASARLHGAYRDALRDLRESERRLDGREVGHVDGRLEPELRWIAEVRDAAKDARWRESALLMGLLCVVSVVLGVWVLTEGVRTIDALAVLALMVAAVLVTLLLALDGRRIRGTLAATVRQSRLWGLLQLENALSDTHRATIHLRDAHRAWLQALAAGHPLAGVLARWRERRFRRADRRRTRTIQRLEKWSAGATVLDDLGTAGVRLPEGYVQGLRGLVPLVRQPVPRLDDEGWDTALADLTRAEERDTPRRLRWLAALATCAELRDDPAARESAARWTLEMAARAHADRLDTRRRGIAADRYDPLPDAAVVEPRRPVTWEGALRRARETGAHPALLASVLVGWAYTLVLDRPTARDVDALIAPAVDAAVDIMQRLSEPEVDRYLRLVRGGLAELGASGAQMGRLVPPRARPATRPAAAAAATRPAASPATRPETRPTTRPATGATGGRTPAAGATPASTVPPTTAGPVGAGSSAPAPGSAGGSVVGPTAPPAGDRPPT